MFVCLLCNSARKMCSQQNTSTKEIARSSEGAFLQQGATSNPLLLKYDRISLFLLSLLERLLKRDVL